MTTLDEKPEDVDWILNLVWSAEDRLSDAQKDLDAIQEALRSVPVIPEELMSAVRELELEIEVMVSMSCLTERQS